MFEKEAEEIAKDIYIHRFDDDINYPDVLKAITVGVQKGAEFGYNKANEKHKQDELGLIISNSSARAELEKQLAQAKEIIKDLLNLPFANNEEVYADITSHLDRAEQFLKEE